MNREVGRPRIFQTREDLISVLNKYFQDTAEERITITGLCLELGIDKDTFYEYAKREEFKDIINEARMLVENSYELSLRKYGRTGDIFALKNFGWKDKQEVDLGNKDNQPFRTTDLSNLTTEEIRELLKNEDKN